MLELRQLRKRVRNLEALAVADQRQKTQPSLAAKTTGPKNDHPQQGPLARPEDELKAGLG
jgi:hypothetical protein